MKLHLDRQAAQPLYLQIAGSLREQITSGLLPEGQRLPTERELARELDVNRSTILAAYAELKADGLVEAHVGRGTVVLPQTFAARATGPVTPFSWRQITRRSAAPEPLPIIRDLLELAGQKGVVPLSVGLPAPELVPAELVSALQQRVLQQRGAEALLQSPTEGIASLRESIAERLQQRGIACSAAEVLITSGSQQGLDLIRRVLVEPGDFVVVEQPAFFGALECFRNAGARLLPVPVDEHGMRVDVLEEMLGRSRPRLIYTLPTFQNPSGVCLSLERRKQLLEVAHRFQVPIVEDDLYFDLRYQDAPLPPLRALDPGGYVLYLCSASKVLFPGLRLGWLVAPRGLVRSLALAKQAVDLHSGTLGQWLLDALLREGHYASHVQAVRQAYAAKRDTMIDALERHKPEGLAWRTPAGGYYVWCSYPSRIPPTRLLAHAARERVSFLPGEACLTGELAQNYLRLNFTFPTRRQITQGIERLSRALQAASRERPRPRAGHPETTPII